MTALTALLVACLAAFGQEDAWSQLWTELEALRSGMGRPEPAEAELYREHLTAALRAAPEGPRAALLAAALGHLAGADATATAVRLANLQPDPFSSREDWLLADLLPSGRVRARVVQRALAADTRLTTWQVLLAWNAAVDEARAFRLEESTLPIQLRLREIYQDAWSANELALTYKALGQGQAADRLLGEAISAELETGRRAAELWETRGINALAFGSEGLARDYLGKAMAYGSPGAALLLARLDLSAGRTTQARSAFRALLLDQPSPDWAWRGWGMALLPDPIVAPGSLSPVLSKP